jgi:hypothetical protein
MGILRVKKRKRKEKTIGRIKVAGKKIKVTETKTRYRYRVREPKKGAKYRVLDIGKPRKHQIVRMKPRKAKKWKTQSVIVEKKLVKNPLKPKGETREILEKAVKY